MSDYLEEETEESNVVNIDQENLPDEAPLNESEEKSLQQNNEERALEELIVLKNRVMSIKRAIEEPHFLETFIKPIRGNIEDIKEKLETMDKARNIAMAQGQLVAFRKMINFPETAVEALNAKVSEIKRNLPLFYGEDETVKSCQRVYFDKDLYQIVME